MKISTHYGGLVAILCGAMGTGCAQIPGLGGSRLGTENFNRQPAEQRAAKAVRGNPPAAPTQTVAAAAPLQETVTDLPRDIDQDAAVSTQTSQADSAHGSERMVVDANVGHIYGRPVYASDIFRDIGHEQLRRLGQVHPRPEFRQEVQRLLAEKLMQWVEQRLVLAEAESALSEREHLGLAGYMRQVRERLLARYGGGVLAVANEQLLRQEGRTLDQQLEWERQMILQHRYFDQKVRSRVDVNRREVERYYHDHYEEFNPAPSVTLRLLRVADPAVADRVDAELAQGEPFAEVAARYSSYRANEGGLMSPIQLTGPFEEFNALGSESLNAAVRSMEPGQHSERIEAGGQFTWILLQSLQVEEGRSLEDVFLELERKLRRMKEDRLLRQIRDDLLAKGNYTPREVMLSRLVETAMDRYAQAQ